VHRPFFIEDNSNLRVLSLYDLELFSIDINQCDYSLKEIN